MIRRLKRDYLRKATLWVPLSMLSLVLLYVWAGNEPSHPVTRPVGFSLNAVAFAALILWAVQRQNEPASALFRWTPVRWLGKISYGVYLLQLPVQSMVKLLIKSPLLGTSQRAAAQSLAWLTTTLAVAWLSWRYFEKPLQDYGHELTTRKPRLSGVG